MSRQAELAREYAATVKPRFDTCLDGHPLTEGNVIYIKTRHNGGPARVGRICKTCHREAALISYHNRKGLQSAAR